MTPIIFAFKLGNFFVISFKITILQVSLISNNTAISLLSCGAVVNMIMFALDKQAWRDVRINTIVEWYEGMPKEEN